LKLFENYKFPLFLFDVKQNNDKVKKDKKKCGSEFRKHCFTWSFNFPRTAKSHRGS